MTESYASMHDQANADPAGWMHVVVVVAVVVVVVVVDVVVVVVLQNKRHAEYALK